MAGVTMVQALNQAMREEMARDETVLLLGEDVGVDGGIFRVSDGLLDEFGEKRVVDTPLSEVAIVGSAIGLALYGFRPIAELQFSGFSYQAFHQVEGHVSRYRKRSQGRYTVPLVIRMPYGAGVRALEHHSESREAYYAHTPGLKVVIPRSPRKAWELLKASIRDPDPVVFMEPKGLYRRGREELPKDRRKVPALDGAEIVQEGEDITVVAYGAMLYRAMEAVKTLEREDVVNAEIIDLQMIAPLDSDTVNASVQKTGRAVVIHEAPRTLGVGAEIAARITEESFLSLEAPVKRITGYDVQVPLFAREQLYLPSEERILQGMRDTLAF
ncbi:MAG: alpha-ketoacid dehydrogenase subunit beta [Candidatus Thermoplasmatota archaeon]|nr:alpha-ketoacid dehydrogenase subunit beta [Candidatus Thermoplasmatota archaeon]